MKNTLYLIDANSLIFIVLFVIPIAAKLIYNAHLAKYPVKETDEKLRNAQLIIFSVVVFALNATIFNDLYIEFINQASVFEPIQTTLAIVSINVISSFACCFLLNLIISAYYCLKNKLLRISGDPTHSAVNSMWQVGFYGQKILDSRGNLVKVEQGNIESIGFLDYYSSKGGEENAIIIQHCDIAQEYLARDMRCAPKDRIFGEIKNIYCDMGKGFKITFYEMDKYFEFLERNALNHSSPEGK